jgi:hypothetical protein
MADISVVKHKRSKPIRSCEKCLLNVFNTLCQENPEVTVGAVAEIVPQDMGIWKDRVHRIQKETLHSASF